MSKGYKIDFTTNTITMNYTFAAAAEEYGTPEYNTLKGILEDFPNMSRVVKSGRTQKKASSRKNMTYEKMGIYISTFANAEQINANFEIVKLKSKNHASPYKYVCEWFFAQFPEVKEAIKNRPSFKDTELLTEVIPFSEVEKEKKIFDLTKKEDNSANTKVS